MEWQWFKQHSIAFKTVKKYLTESPVLKYYDVKDDVTIQCDAFETGLGTILTQSRQAVSYARPRKAFNKFSNCTESDIEVFESDTDR